MTTRRWALHTLLPLHKRWLEGESIKAIAEGVGSSSGRLRKAFVTHGLHSVPPKQPRKLQRGEAGYADQKHIFVEAWKPKRDFDPEAHYAMRHYKGCFEL